MGLLLVVAFSLSLALTCLWLNLLVEQVVVCVCRVHGGRQKFSRTSSEGLVPILPRGKHSGTALCNQGCSGEGRGGGKMHLFFEKRKKKAWLSILHKVSNILTFWDPKSLWTCSSEEGNIKLRAFDHEKTAITKENLFF